MIPLADPDGADPRAADARVGLNGQRDEMRESQTHRWKEGKQDQEGGDE